MTRRTRLEVAPLEDRVTPVAGGYDVPFAADTDDAIKAGSADLTGVVSINNNATGALLDRGAIVVGSRQILTAAHSAPAVGDVVTFYHRLPDGNLEQVQIPVLSVWIEPTYTAPLPGGGASNPANNIGDVALVTLAAIAPFGVTDYPIYTAAEAAVTSEVGKAYIVAGYGQTGTGTSGASASQEIQRMTVTATGGAYQIVRPDTGAQSPTLPSNATAAQVQAAFAALGLPATVTLVTVFPVAPPSNVTTYEVKFTAAANLPRMSFATNGLNPLINGGNAGTVAFTTLVNGGINAEYQRVTVNATAGTFRLGYGGPTGTQFTVPIPYNATAAQVQAALEGLNTPGPGPGEVTVRQVPAGALNAGSYQISFDSIGFDIPLLVADTTTLTGTASVATIQDGGQRVLRAGANEYDAIVQGTLTSDLDPDGTDVLPQTGDDGAAGFIDTGSGRLAIASLVSHGGGGYGSTENDTRVSKYATDILNEAAGMRVVGGVLVQQQDPITLNMNYQFSGNDGVADTITVKQTTIGGSPVVQIWVQSAGGAAQLYYQDLLAGISSLRLIGSADDETFVIDPSMTKLVSVDGGFGNDTLIGPTAATAWKLTAADQGTGDTPAIDFDFKQVENLTGGGGADTFAFDVGGSLSGKLDGGGGSDTIDFALRGGTTAHFTGPGTTDGFVGTVPTVAGGFDNVNGFAGNPNAGTDVVFTPDTGGVVTHAGAGGTYADSSTGRVLTYANVDVLNGGAAADTYNILSTTAAFAVNGGAGDDVVNVAGDAPTNTAAGALGGGFTFTGGLGNDLIRVNGTAADEAVTASVSGPNTATVAVLGQTVTLNDTERFLFNGLGGTNTFTALDTSNTSLGTPTDPGSGVVYYPTGTTGGNARINGVTVGGTSLSGFTVNGDPDGSGDKDVLLAVGTSAPGLQSAFGEAVVGDGRDTITISDTSVGFKSALAGVLLPLTIGYTPAGAQAFSTLYVAGGNESGNEGDTINVPTTLTFNLVADGMLPSATIRPGDRVIVTAPGGGDSQLVTDPALGPTQTRVTARADGSSAGLLGFESGTPPVAGAGMLAVGTDAGVPSTIRVFDRITGAFRYEVTPFADFSAGVKVASGDVNGDGVADLVVGAGPGGGPRVAVFDGLTGGLIYDFFGYEDTFRGGVTVAVGDVNQDGFGDLILGTGVGGGPRVRVLSGKDLTPIRDAFAYEPTFRGGVSVAAGDVNGDGVPDLITSTGSGGGPRVVVLDGRTTAQLASFFVFDPNTRIGFTAAGGDVNGDGFADIVVGAGAGSAAEVRVFSGFNRAKLNDFYINDPFNAAATGSAIGSGVRVAVSDVDGDGVGDIVTGLGPGGDSVVRTYKVTGVNPQTNALFPTLQEIRRQTAFDDGFANGIFVGASD